VQSFATNIAVFVANDVLQRSPKNGWRQSQIKCGLDAAYLASMNFSSLSSTGNGDGEMFYAPVASGTYATAPNERIVFVKEHHDHKIEFPNTSIADLPSFRTIVKRAQVRCTDHSYSNT
jgi:hypothetical protein